MTASRGWYFWSRAENGAGGGGASVGLAGRVGRAGAHGGGDKVVDAVNLVSPVARRQRRIFSTHEG